jgi:hypothetical protein
MRKKLFYAALYMGIGVFLFTARVGAVPDLCQRVDEKPVLSLQTLRQADFVHMLVTFSGMQPPAAEGKTPEQYYDEEVQMLLNAGYPSTFAEIEPDRIVTRRYYASFLYQLLVENDSEFASRYGGLHDETAQLQALVSYEAIYSDGGSIYREEILASLCNKFTPPKQGLGFLSPEPILLRDLQIAIKVGPERPGSKIVVP